MPQRQRLPPRPWLTSAPVGFGCSSRKPLQAITKPGRAVAALLGVVVHEGVGDGMQVVAGGEAFDGLDILALRVDGEHVQA